MRRAAAAAVPSKPLFKKKKLKTNTSHQDPEIAFNNAIAGSSTGKFTLESLRAAQPETLKIKNSTLADIPDSFCFTLTCLQRLNLAYNHIRFLPSAFGSLVNLIVLDLSHNLLKQLPATFTKLVKLEGVLLSRNQFVLFPEELLSLPKLIRLELTKNRIREVPTEITRLSASLQILNLGHNYIESLPNEIGRLDRLQEMGLSYNLYFRLVLPELFTCPLRMLDLRGCPHCYFPPQFVVWHVSTLLP
eukprot:TRINITY_DN11203_c0_g1_i1.p1 TRINITY_DN11203_c0_g1~~TRINITY_DN11203_c0_g1_i1.p1  ORF type:complete len:246 (-),score=55.78 TRINITY_DN11203_c0_g1_i1:122-859(-)